MLVGNRDDIIADDSRFDARQINEFFESFHGGVDVDGFPVDIIKKEIGIGLDFLQRLDRAFQTL